MTISLFGMDSGREPPPLTDSDSSEPESDSETDDSKVKKIRIATDDSDFSDLSDSWIAEGSISLMTEDEEGKYSVENESNEAASPKQNISADEILQADDSIIASMESLETVKMNINYILSKASNCFISNIPYQTMEMFGEALDIIEKHCSDPQFENMDIISTDKIVVIKFLFARACTNTLNYSNIISGQAKLNDIIFLHKQVTFPAVYLGFAFMFRALNRYRKALQYTEKGCEFFNKKCSCDTFNYPGIAHPTPIDETNIDILKKMFDDLKAELKCPPKPAAICKYSTCLEVNKDTHIIPSNNIYLSDPDYKGYFKIWCHFKCTIDFHQHCWQEQIKPFETEKDFLGLTCLTPDCKGIIIKIQIYDINADYITVEDKNLYEKIKNKNKRKKKENHSKNANNSPSIESIIQKQQKPEAKEDPKAKKKANKAKQELRKISIFTEVKEKANIQEVIENKENENTSRSDLQQLKTKVQTILNNLTIKSFQPLMEKFQELQIDNQETLTMCVELVFEKALNESSLSDVYARMCQLIQWKKVPVDGGQEEEFVNFKRLLIARCQKQFEMNYIEDVDKMSNKSLGAIRFIGELYLLKILTGQIMHECVKKLLMATDDDSLECLCLLLTSIGQDLENETKARLVKGPQRGISDLSVYFEEMCNLVERKKTSSRIGFLIEDLIQLRLNGWKKINKEDTCSNNANISPEPTDKIPSLKNVANKELVKVQTKECLSLEHHGVVGRNQTNDNARHDKKQSGAILYQPGIANAVKSKPENTTTEGRGALVYIPGDNGSHHNDHKTVPWQDWFCSNDKSYINSKHTANKDLQILDVPPACGMHQNENGLENKKGTEDIEEINEIVANMHVSKMTTNQVGDRRTIVIDGSNVAMAHGRDQLFSPKGIKIVTDHFQRLGHKVVVFLPQHRKKPNKPGWEVLNKLHELDILQYTPSRWKHTCYDDNYIIDYAIMHGGVVVSRDNFRDLVGVSVKPGVIFIVNKIYARRISQRTK